MKEDTELKETTSRRQFTKAAVIAAIAAPIAAVLASCTKQPSQNKATPPASPAPTEHPFDGDGSPITVGGGGGNLKKDKTEERNVSCMFKEDPEHFPEDPGNPAHGKKKFKNKKGWKIQTFKIRSKGVWADYSKDLPSNGKCTISILCAGDDTDVRIDGDVFGVQLNTDKYQKQSDGYYRNPSDSENIIRVILTTAGQTVTRDFDAADECLVCTDFVTTDKTMCGRPTPTPTP
ncbi:MAG TPA: hypothetical protein VGP81_15195 [Pyrinomonadaceae bacterium]|jgi:hypothetical protein|nr:hypothetical protein [Pyrinomonadaceae bacterium]